MKALFSTLAVIMALLLSASCGNFDDIEAMRKLRYETGANKGAKFCSTCHEEIYRQWSNSSRHFQATKSPNFHNSVAEYRESFLLSRYIDEDMCYSCHGDKKINEGVNCESCHGSVIKGVPIEVTHEKKYTPRLAKMRQSEFCAKCHQMALPISGELLTSTYDEWRKSPAGKTGKTCSSCHMAKRRNDEHAYHGFESALRDISIYKNDFHLRVIEFTSHELKLVLENRVMGHSIPAGGPTRVLALELSVKDKSGKTLHRDLRTYTKKFSLIPFVGVAPFHLIEDTRLRAGEKRSVRFELPGNFSSKSIIGELKLRMYEVADRHMGNLEKAHWRSDTILRKKASLQNYRQ